MLKPLHLPVTRAAMLLSLGATAGACITVEQASPVRRDVDASSDALAADALVQDATASDAAASLRARASVYSANGHAYLVVCSGKIRWNDARQAAQGAGGQLVSLTSKDENSFVAALAAKALRPECWDDFNGPWLGAQRNELADGGPGAWVWLTGEPWDDGNALWHPSQPDNSGNRETALQAFDYKGSLGWNDNDPGVSVPGYVIEWDK